MKNIILNSLNKICLLSVLAILIMLTSCSQSVKNQPDDKENNMVLKTAFKEKFLIGTAMNKDQILGTDTNAVALIKEEFNSIVSENCMKSENLQPEQGVFDFDLSDKFVEFGLLQNMFIHGHVLVWHSQAPKWIFVDKNGVDVSRDTLIERMRKHIYTVVGRYKGKVNSWDVVNEAVDDNIIGLRQSKWLQIIGDDFISLAFQFAHEADPEAELYYNDYSLFQENKREATIKIVKSLQEKGIRIDGVGMQGHYAFDFPDLAEMEKSIVAFASLGVKVMFTEVDISVLPRDGQAATADIAMKNEYRQELNPYTEMLPDSIQNKLTKRYLDIFEILVKHSDKISRVTFWGVNDGQSWLNNWPIKNRTNYPLLFDRQNKPKPAYYSILKLVEEINHSESSN